jgi:protein quaking
MLLMIFIYFVTEIGRVRSNLFQINGIKKEPLVLPEAQGPATTLSEKVYVPVKEHPDVSTKTNLF